MIDFDYGWSDVDEGNKTDGHYHRFNSLKPVALQNAERALEIAKSDRILITKLYDRGLAMSADLVESIKVEAIVTNLKNLLTDFWFIEINAKDAAIRTYQRGEMSYPFDIRTYSENNLERSES
jgi:hypothetical protein